jgi:hypothetical protein
MSTFVRAGNALFNVDFPTYIPALHRPTLNQGVNILSETF